MPEHSNPIGAVFISYGSQDAPAAVRICEAVRAAGVEVWFEQNELRGGDMAQSHATKTDRRDRQAVTPQDSHLHARSLGADC